MIPSANEKVAPEQETRAERAFFVPATNLELSTHDQDDFPLSLKELTLMGGTRSETRKIVAVSGEKSFGNRRSSAKAKKTKVVVKNLEVGRRPRGRPRKHKPVVEVEMETGTVLVKKEEEEEEEEKVEKKQTFVFKEIEEKRDEVVDEKDDDRDETSNVISPKRKKARIIEDEEDDSELEEEKSDSGKSCCPGWVSPLVFILVCFEIQCVLMGNPSLCPIEGCLTYLRVRTQTLILGLQLVKILKKIKMGLQRYLLRIGIVCSSDSVSLIVEWHEPFVRVYCWETGR